MVNPHRYYFRSRGRLRIAKAIELTRAAPTKEPTAMKTSPTPHRPVSSKRAEIAVNAVPIASVKPAETLVIIRFAVNRCLWPQKVSAAHIKTKLVQAPITCIWENSFAPVKTSHNAAKMMPTMKLRNPRPYSRLLIVGEHIRKPLRPPCTEQHGEEGFGVEKLFYALSGTTPMKRATASIAMDTMQARHRTFLW